MKDSCDRSAFSFPDGCPPVEVDLDFPDFDACDSAVTTDLRSASRLNLQRVPAFPAPVVGMDILPNISTIGEPVVDFECPYEAGAVGPASSHASLGDAFSNPSVSAGLSGNASSCTIRGMYVNMSIPDMRPLILNKDSVDVLTGQRVDSYSLAGGLSGLSLAFPVLFPGMIVQMVNQ